MAESREQRAESREQRAESSLTADKKFVKCCYCNYKRIFKTDVKIGMAVLARDYKGFGSGLIPSNGVIIKT